MNSYVSLIHGPVGISLVILTQCRITWEDSLNERLSTLSWTLSVSVGDHLKLIYVGKAQPPVSSTTP